VRRVSSSVLRVRVPHLPALDGLRGAALLGVLFFHANGALPGGYLGVDLFFVLSGFLITSVLLAEQRQAGRIVLGAFWVRRARRLFPALLSLMPAIALYGRFFASPGDLRALGGDALATLGYVANWRTIVSEKSYWDLFAAPSPLEHTWSLSIEEQFYVVWPVVVVLLLRRGTSRSVGLVALALAAASILTTLGLYEPARASRVYLGTDTRAAGILLGAAAATVISPGTTFASRTIRALDAVGIVSAALLGVAWWSLRGESPFLYRGGLWLTELAAIALIACAVAGQRSLVGRALSCRVLVWVGTISYGLYLWHWPINVFLCERRVHLHGAPLHALQIATTFAIATLSYRHLEQPIRLRGVPFGRPVYMVPAAVVLAVLLVVRATYARLPAPEPLAMDVASSVPSPGPTLRVLVVGDSTANSLGWTLRGLRDPGLNVELRGKDGCTMLADTCGGASWAADTVALQPNATLAFLGGAFLHGVTADGTWQKSCHRAWDDAFEDNLRARLAALASHRGRVWAVTVPYPLGVYDDATFRGEVDCINASIRKVAAAVPGVRILDLAERLCPSGVCVREAEGAVIRPDGVHYSIDGGRDLARWVLDQIRQSPTAKL
jgi:peptidoglycan/LPS O-acetylase OafA/YrhL